MFWSLSFVHATRTRHVSLEVLNEPERRIWNNDTRDAFHWMAGGHLAQSAVLSLPCLYILYKDIYKRENRENRERERRRRVGSRIGYENTSSFREVINDSWLLELNKGRVCVCVCVCKRIVGHVTYLEVVGLLMDVAGMLLDNNPFGCRLVDTVDRVDPTVVILSRSRRLMSRTLPKIKKTRFVKPTFLTPFHTNWMAYQSERVR